MPTQTQSYIHIPSCFYPLPTLPPQLFFPQIFDIKYLMKFCDNLHGGLNKLAETLDVERIGPQHQVDIAMLVGSLLLAVCVLWRVLGRIAGCGAHRASAPGACCYRLV